MSDRTRPVLPDLSAVSTSTLLEWIQELLSELTLRFADSSVPPVTPGAAPSVSSWDFVPPVDPALRRPWACGFHCRWCDSACTRAEGHKHHSCWEHRHRR